MRLHPGPQSICIYPAIRAKDWVTIARTYLQKENAQNTALLPRQSGVDS